jgi:hypothetical protein
MYCVGIFGVRVTGVLVIHKATEMKDNFVTHEEKPWIPSGTDCNNQRKEIMHATASTGLSFWTNGTS